MNTRSKITKVEDGGKPRIVATVEVEEQLPVPTSIKYGKTVDMLSIFIAAIGGYLLNRPTKIKDRWVYEIAIKHSNAIPNGTRLRKVLEKMLTVFETCSKKIQRGNKTSRFFEIDHARPNVTSSVMLYCLNNNNIFTRRLVQMMKHWLTDDFKVKSMAIREFYNEDVLVGPTRPSRKEMNEFEETIDTRRVYLTLIDLFENDKFGEALELASNHNF